jgi:cytoskeletal protein CcmA (bactofilin family)
MFNKKSAPVQRQQAGSSAMATTFSILGADVAIKGDLRASADLHIDGSVEGDITCTALVQGESSTVTGAIRAETARLSGTIHGSIEAGELVILKSARIHGDVTYDSLTIEQGAQVDGKFSHRVQLTEETSLSLVS